MLRSDYGLLDVYLLIIDECRHKRAIFAHSYEVWSNPVALSSADIMSRSRKRAVDRPRVTTQRRVIHFDV